MNRFDTLEELLQEAVVEQKQEEVVEELLREAVVEQKQEEVVEEQQETPEEPVKEIEKLPKINAVK
jgi:hypothetical protein